MEWADHIFSVGVMVLDVGVKLEMLSDSPVAEISESNISNFVPWFFDFVESCDWIFNLYSPFGHQWDCLREFLLPDSPVVWRIDLIEVNPVLIVLSHVDQEEDEFSFWNIVVSMRVFGFQFGSGSCEGSDDDGFEFKQFGELDHIPNSLVNFGQTEVAIAVHIKLMEKLPSCLILLRSTAERDLFQLLTCAVSHCQISYINWNGSSEI